MLRIAGLSDARVDAILIAASVGAWAGEGLDAGGEAEGRVR